MGGEGEAGHGKEECYEAHVRVVAAARSEGVKKEAGKEGGAVMVNGARDWDMFQLVEWGNFFVSRVGVTLLTWDMYLLSGGEDEVCMLWRGLCQSFFGWRRREGGKGREEGA